MRGKSTIVALILTASASYGGWAELWGNMILTTGSAVYTPTAATNLILRWDFNSGTCTNVPDVSGNGNNATQTATNNAPVLSGGYASFSGTNYLQTTNSLILNGASEFTATMWVYVNSYTDYSIPFMSYSATKYAGIEFDTFASKKAYSHYKNGINVLSDATISTGQWVFVAAWAKPGDYMGVVVNSAFKRTSLLGGSSMSIDSPWCVGCNKNYSVAPFSGLIDECRIYSRALTSNEIVAVKSEGRP